jgi:hypothetical protein
LLAGGSFIARAKNRLAIVMVGEALTSGVVRTILLCATAAPPTSPAVRGFRPHATQ